MGTKGRVPHLRPKSLYPCFYFHWAGLCPEKLAKKGTREEGEPFEGNKNNTMWFQKLSRPPPKKGFFLRPPTSLEIPVKLHTLTKNLWPFENLPSIECFHMTSRRPYWCPKTMKRQPCWCPKPILWELNCFLMQTFSFVPINLHKAGHVSENTL